MNVISEVNLSRVLIEYDGSDHDYAKVVTYLTLTYGYNYCVTMRGTQYVTAEVNAKKVFEEECG